jgi:hypothetical protein
MEKILQKYLISLHCFCPQETCEYLQDKKWQVMGIYLLKENLDHAAPKASSKNSELVKLHY